MYSRVDKKQYFCTSVLEILHWNQIIRPITSFQISLSLQSFLYLAWYTTMSILGHYNNFFFAAHLLDIAMGFKTLRTILSSVTHNGKQVSITYRALKLMHFVTILEKVLGYLGNTTIQSILTMNRLKNRLLQVLCSTFSTS